MRLEWLPPKQSRSFSVVYRLSDHALQSVPKPAHGFTSLSINSVQIEFTEHGLADYIWGYCPRQSWQATEAEAPGASTGELRVIPEGRLTPGVSLQDASGPRPVFYNERTKWLCLGDPLAMSEFRMKFAPGCIAVGSWTELDALWLRLDRFEP
jgi:hypothetical protein